MLFDGGYCEDYFLECEGGFNCPLKRGSVRRVLRRYSCNVAILLESKLEEVDRQVVHSLWGRR